MKILKYKKQKNGFYQVFFDNDYDVDLHEKIILKYDLLIKKEASSKDIDKMLDENKKYIGYDLSIKYLAKKMRTKKEIDDYLKKNNIDDNTRSEIIELLFKEGYLNEDMYVKAYINDRILLSNDGPNKIKHQLKDLGIDTSIIESNIETYDDKLQKERINNIINKQIKNNKNKSINILKNKLKQYLNNLGYSSHLINECIDGINIKDDLSIIKKEYDKIYKKLSKKYSGSELEYRIKQKMYQLGFNNYNE